MPTNVLHINQSVDYINQYYQLYFSDEQLSQFSARLNIATSSKALGKLYLEQVKAKAASGFNLAGQNPTAALPE